MMASRLASELLYAAATGIRQSREACTSYVLGNFGAWQSQGLRSFASASQSAHAAASSASSAAAGAAPAEPKAGKADKKKGGAKPGAGSGAAAAGGKGGQQQGSKPEGLAALDPSFSFRPSRFLAHYQQHLLRESLLKLGATSPRWQAAPRIKSIVLTINAANDTRLESAVVDKRELLLHALALEHVAGGGPRPRFIAPPGRTGGPNAAGVEVEVTGSRALDVLEKLTTAILPQQMSFEGLGPALRIERKGRRNAGKGPLYAVDVRVDNLMLYPDFEARFELFEPLRSMQVRVVVENANTAEAARTFLSGFGLPLVKGPSGVSLARGQGQAARKEKRA